jgi:ribose transport system substrate-binding protein
VRDTRWLRVRSSLIAVLALAAVGCGQTSGSSVTSSGSLNLAYVQGQIAKYSAVPEFTAPGPAFDATKAQGKSIYNIPFDSGQTFNQVVDQTMANVAKQVGVKFINYPNQGSTAAQLQGIENAIAQKASLIFLEGSPDPSVFVPQLTAAHNAGIPVVVSHFYDASQTPPSNLPFLINVPARHDEASRLEADYAISDSKGHAHVMIITANEISPARGMVSAIQGELTTYCGSGCTSTIVNVAIVDFATKVQSEVQSALVRDPSINYVIPFIDGLTLWAAPGIVAANKQNTVKIVSYNGSAFVLKKIQDKNIVVADVGEDLTRIGYANMDAALRALTGAQPVSQEAYVLRVWDSTNVSEAGTPPVQTQGYGTAYISGFSQLWGVTLK